jgi:diguanylate cyclase (GGDEF)-like protein
VRPFFFQRHSFIAGAFLIAAAGVFVAIRRRTREHRRREIELERRIADATDELRRAHDELAVANRRLQDLSLEDPLTGVANRRRFDQALELLWEQARRSGSPVALLMVDIDHFKAFNDHFGHRAGDDCLRRTADILGSAARRAADLIARYGGEEFAVLLPNTELGAACQIAEELRAAVEAASIHHPASDHAGRLTISVGVAAAIPTSNEPSAALVEGADRALYRAKSGGRNRVESG